MKQKSCALADIFCFFRSSFTSSLVYQFAWISSKVESLLPMSPDTRAMTTELDSLVIPTALKLLFRRCLSREFAFVDQAGWEVIDPVPKGHTEFFI